MLASPAVFRRQQFLLRCLGGFGDCTYQNRRQQIKAMSGTSIEADAEHILRAITPCLDPNRYKGQAGKFSTYSVLLWFFICFQFAMNDWLKNTRVFCCHGLVSYNFLVSKKLKVMVLGTL